MLWRLLAAGYSHFPMHDDFMQIALEEAEQALREDEVPIGAVIVHDGRVIARRTTSGNSSATRRPTPR